MMTQNLQSDGFDQLSIERTVQRLSRTSVRSPLKIERIKQWVKQFQSPEEKTLAWLILRNLIYRTGEQWQSSMRQALKLATIHFVDQLNLSERVDWSDALCGKAGLDFYCGPPSLATNGLPATPGKSGDLVVRLVNQRFGITKQFPSDVTTLGQNERFIVVDDGTYTGSQLEIFLRSWGISFSDRRIAIAVALAHTTALEYLKEKFPNVPLFYGELLAPEMCFAALSASWIETEQWHYSKTPLEVYGAVHTRNQPFNTGNGGHGYEGIGALVAFEHGVPDDSIQLLWDESPTWKPLVDR